MPWFMLPYKSTLEKAMATHSSTLVWKIPWTEDPGRLQSMRSLRVRHDWATSLSLFTFMHWRRKWQPTPVFLPGKSHGLRILVGYSPWDRKESDTTERLHFTQLKIRGYRGWWFETSKGRKVIHMEMEKPNVCWSRQRQWDTEWTLISKNLPTPNT